MAKAKKIPGEQLKFIDIATSANIKLTEDQINKKYLKGDTRIVTEQARYPLSSIENMVDGGSYKLDPDFQRRKRWNKIKQSRLIESFIMNVPIPPVFLYEDDLSHYEVMDGLQRLTAIYEFYTNRFKLQGLEEWPELNGYKYQNLPEQVKKGIDRRYLSSIILLHETAKSPEIAAYLKQMVFERINSGGEKLSHHESRNALYSGKFNELCRKLSKNSKFRELWDIPAPAANVLDLDDSETDESDDDDLRNNKYYATMYDVELVLRFFAYRQKERKRKTSLKIMLDKYFMVANNTYDRETLKSLENLFNETIDLVYACFGDGAFWLYRVKKSSAGKTWSWFKRPTIVMYDCIMNVMSNQISNSAQLKKNSKKIQKDLPEFLKQHAAEFEGRNVNENTVRQREELFEEFISNYI